MIAQVRSALDIPVMGSGGVASARDVLEMMMAGATGIQIGAESLRNPLVIPQILEELPGLMDELGIERLEEIIGAAL